MSVIKKLKKLVTPDYTTLPITDREALFKNELQSIMTKYNCGLSVAIVDSTPFTLPSIEL